MVMATIFSYCLTHVTFIYTKTASCEKRVRPQNAWVKKDVKSKVVAKKWL